MNEIIELRAKLAKAEQEYKTAQTSLDGSLALILAREVLKTARFDYKEACFDLVEDMFSEGVFGNVHESENV